MVGNSWRRLFTFPRRLLFELLSTHSSTRCRSAFVPCTDDADSSDDEVNDDDDEDQEQIMKNLKNLVKKKGQKQELSRGASLSRKMRSDPGKTVLYIGHLPREFEEKELAHFLKQFGRVVNLRLARSKRTGNSKGFGFVQMSNEDTARIVADTLAGYILMGQRRLVCHVVPPEKIHSNLFYHAKPPKKAPGPNRSLEKIKTVTAKLVARERKKKALLKEAGIDYDFPGYESGKKTPTAEDPSSDSEEEVVETVVERGRKPRKGSTDESDKKKKRSDSVDSAGRKKRTDSMDSMTKRRRSHSADSAGKKKRSDSVGSSSKKKRSDSVDSSSRKKRSDSVDSSSRKKRSDSVDSASKNKNKRKDSVDASEKETQITSSSTSNISRKRSDSTDSTGKKKRSVTVDSVSKKAEKKEGKKKRKEDDEHDESPKVKKRKKSVDKTEKPASAVKAPAEKSLSKSKKSKRRSI